MLSDIFFSPVQFFFSVIALLLAITVHEFAHALVADRLGDPTARLAGRLTLNPLSHLDPIGTLALLLFHFGWGKPVPFDAFNLKNPRTDSALISLAGPVSNILIATAASALYHLTQFAFVGIGATLFSGLLTYIVFINVILAIFNLLPVHPLDGFKIVGGLLSDRRAAEWYELSRYGLFFLIFLLLPFGPSGSILQNILSPGISLVYLLLQVPFPSF